MMHQAHGIDLMDIAAGGHLNQQTMSWLGERAETLRYNLSSAAISFFDQARNVYQMISTSDAVQALRNLTAKVDNVWQSNVIHSCLTIEELQTANPFIQRYIMAEPRLRTMYLNNEVEGYNESYTNCHGNNVGSNHYDWRRVMDQVVVVNDKGFEINHYYEELSEGEKELSIHEKVDILRTWNMVNHYLDENELDPTSPVGNMLG